MVRLVAMVLAGGKSSRMGQDKALLPIGEVPLLQQVCQVARQCAPTVYVVTPWIERYLDLLPEGCVLIQEKNNSPSEQPHGPLVGFAQGLAQVEADWVLLLACDLPYLQSDVLLQWSGQLAEVPDGAIALLPHHPKGWEPLCGFYRQRCLPSLQTFIQGGGRSFQRWLADQTVQALPLPEDQMLFNCNTPEDLAQARQLS